MFCHLGILHSQYKCQTCVTVAYNIVTASISHSLQNCHKAVTLLRLPSDLISAFCKVEKLQFRYNTTYSTVMLKKVLPENSS